MMERRAFTALAASLSATAVAGCFGPRSTPGGNGTDVETGAPGTRDVRNELKDIVVLTDETLLEEDGQLTFRVSVENISETPVAVDLTATMLDDDGTAVSDEYVESRVAVDAGERRTVTFDVAESPGSVASYRVVVSGAESPDDGANSDEDSEDGSDGGGSDEGADSDENDEAAATGEE